MRISWRRTSTPHPDFYHRLDHELCKYGKDAGIIDHTLCTVWIHENGEIYYIPSNTTCQGASDLEEQYLRWWQRKNRALALLKSCRQIYSEATPLLYTTNTFSFSTPLTFINLFPTILPHRFQSIRSLEFTFSPELHEYLCTSRDMPLRKMCQLLSEMENLKRLIVELTGTMYLWQELLISFLDGLARVRVEGEFVVRLGWGEKWEGGYPGASFRFI
ncbi:uncharacterized protein BDR25DRAFT_339024 [Lindgomyces ingoldianus]|uniref:Uncharacterized protein n=1 Tax=Lindgomyces ingoldianus TaxID=673940 RepID=A0ACB6RCV3_9PLEO|nr:uncharacterized protein BDR25DRAFT_339024 [Lindgomyces ingoldianus]KAF2476927.1 hypothetical protein BDR25DRAFT_339024 [Lindgomyces ingoldianus]